MNSNKLVLGSIFLILLFGLSTGCSSQPSKPDTNPYQYRDLPEQPHDFISAPQDPREHQPDAASAMAQWAVATDKPSQTSQQPSISGTCVMHSSTPGQNTGEDLSCVRVTLVLLDANGSEVGREMTHKSGKFQFVVSPAGKYTIKPLSAQYSPEFDKPAPFSAGDVIGVKLEIK